MDKQLDFITDDSAFQPYQVRNVLLYKYFTFDLVKIHVLFLSAFYGQILLCE